MGIAGTTAVGLGTMVSLLTAVPASAVAQRSAEPSWGTNGRVQAIAAVGDRVYIGGTFTAVTDQNGLSHAVSNLAVFLPSTGQFDLTWRPATDGAVSAIQVAGSRVYLAGSFKHVDGATRRKLAVVDTTSGALDATWKTTLNKPADSLALSGGYLYMGGQLTQVRDATGRHTVSYVARVSAADGTWDSTWTPTPDARVRKVLASSSGDRIYVGGDFSQVSGVTSARNLASITTTGAVDRAFIATNLNRGRPSPVRDISTDGTSLVVGTAGNGGSCTAVNTATGATQWTKNTNGDLQATAVMNGTAYCGGHFNGAGSFAGLSRYKAAAVDLATGTTLSFNPRFNSALGVWAMTTDSGKLYVGGDFTSINKLAQPHFAVFLDR